MLQHKIQSAFDKNPRLRTLFFFDKEGENEEQIREMQLSGIRIVLFDGRWLYWKIQLSKETNENSLIYFRQASPVTQEEMLDFPMLDLLKANRELRLDDVADFMDEYNLQPYQQPLVSRYRHELSKTSVLKTLEPVLNAAGFDERTVTQGLISAFLDLKKIEDWTVIIIRLLTYAHPEKKKNLLNFFARIRNNRLLESLNVDIRKAFNTILQGQDQEEIIGLIRILKYNAITQNLPVSTADSYRELKIKDSGCLYYLNQILETGLNNSYLSKAFRETLQMQGESIHADKIIEVYGIDEAYEYLPEDLVWEMLKTIVQQDTIQGVERIKRLYTKIKEEGNLRTAPAFLYHVAVMKKLISEAGSGLLDSPETYLEQYVKSGYKIDFHYRKAIFEYSQIELHSTPIEEELSQAKQKADKLYFEFGFVLNDGWLKCLKDIAFDYKKIGCDKQYDFYEHYVRRLQQKRVVIISDALRYEVATELLGELHKDDKNVSELHFQLASIPSTTSVGMANLLPGKAFLFTEDGIYIDGEKTSTTEQREKILQKRSAKSKAIPYETVLRNSKEQNRDLFKSDIVYVYHNVIDNEGHHGTERNTLISVQTAIEELSKLVKRILGGFGVSRVLITADHGFLYNDMEMAENDKNEMQDTVILKSDARHYITLRPQPVSQGYKIPLCNTTSCQEPYYVVFPDAINRFKKQGSRYMFTHAGGSLQELVVPVIVSIRKEERILKKVKPALLERNLTIVSNSLRFQIIQESAISSTEKERVLIIGIYDNQQLVSKEIELTLDAAGDLPTERAFPVSIVLTAKTTGSILKLRIVDKEDRLNPLIEENVKNNTLIGRDF
jgi:uncharacterized protein (TIGR02687 family)